MCPSVLPHPLAFLCEWYSPFKKALVISQCSVSFQQSAAGSTFHRGSAGALMHTQTHSCCYRTLRDTHTGMLAHWHTLTTHTQPLKRTLLPANTHFPWAGRLSLRERTNCSEDLTWLSHKTKREKEQSEQGKKKGGIYLGTPSFPGNGQLVSMTPCLDSPLFLRQKSWKWWMTTSSLPSASMGPFSQPARRWPTCGQSWAPPAADWPSWERRTLLPACLRPCSTTTMVREPRWEWSDGVFLFFLPRSCEHVEKDECALIQLCVSVVLQCASWVCGLSWRTSKSEKSLHSYLCSWE